MFLAGHGIDFVLQHAQRANHARPGFAGLDHVVDVAALGGDEGVGEAVAELCHLFLADGGLVAGGGSSRR